MVVASVSWYRRGDWFDDVPLRTSLPILNRVRSQNPLSKPEFKAPNLSIRPLHLWGSLLVENDPLHFPITADYRPHAADDACTLESEVFKL